MRSVFAALALITATLVFAPISGRADDAVAPAGTAETPKSFIALALADGPEDGRLLVLSFRGANATDVVARAVAACYRQAEPGYMHTCKVWYGSAWIVGTACRQDAATVKLGIGDDPNSPEAARANAVRYIQEVEHGSVSDCRVVAEYNADDMQVARSVAQPKR